MATRTALAKVSRPRLFGVVARERLFKLLDANAGRPSIWIDGPPGAGKTTLVASYVEDRARPCLWYLLEPGDADPASFFHFLLLAAQDLLRRDLADLPRLMPEHVLDLAAFARLFFRALFARLPQNTLLVLDNYQEVGPQWAVHDLVAIAVQEMPAHCSIVAISREPPPTPFIEHVAHGAMLLIGWNQLQFTLDEVRDVSTRRNVSDRWLVEALHRESQGWAAGLTLMLERLNHLGGAARDLPTETRESVFNYFASLLFEQASSEARQILLSIAFLPRVTAALARSLSGREAGGALLEDLYRRRMFIDRRPDAEPVYQFHALFLDFLRARAEAMLVPEVLQQLLRRTARSLEEAGDAEAAIEVWMRAQDWSECARIATTLGVGLLNQGRRQTLIRWLLAIPEPERSQRPWTQYWLGRAQLQTEPQTGLKTLHEALHSFAGEDHAQGRVECLTALLNGSFLGFHALAEMDCLLDQLLAQTQASSQTRSTDEGLRVIGVLCMTLFHVRPWHPLALTSYQKIEALLPRCTDPSVALLSAMAGLVVSGLCGDFERGERIVAMMEPFVLSDSSSPSDAAWSYAQIAWLRFIQARYEDALQAIERGLDIASRHGLSQLKRQLLFWRFTIEWRALGWSRALTTLSEIEAIQAPYGPMSTAQLRLYQARAAGHLGRRDEASRCSLQSQKWALRIGSRLEEVVYSVSNADVQLEAMQWEAAARMIAHAKEVVQSAPLYACFMPAVLMLEGRLAWDQGDVGTGTQRLREALALAHTGNHRFYLRFCDWAMRRMFPLALEEGVEQGLVAELVRRFRIRPPADATEVWPWPMRVVTMGHFRVDVEGEPLEFARKLPRKALTLLKALVAHGRRGATEQLLCDSLWADEDGDAANNALSITVLRLRKLLGSNESVLQKGGKIWLNSEFCWVDAWAFEDAVVAGGERAIDALRLFGGGFLPEDEEVTWTVAVRERIRGRFIHVLAEHGGRLEEAGNAQAAADHYLRGVEADPVVESFHQGLMRCYERLGRRSEAFSVYRRLRHTLSVVLGVSPSDTTQRLFQRMLDDQRAQDEGGGRRCA